MTTDVLDVLDELAGLIGHVTPGQAPLPTPCPEFDVGGLRQHVLGWLPLFATALGDPHGEHRPDPGAYQASDDAATASAEVRHSAALVRQALAAGVGQGTVRLIGGELPGRAVVGMLTGEAIAHGWDLAQATGLPWKPAEAVCETALTELGHMLQPQFRGPGKAFGTQVPVQDDASALDRLLAFTGRDPRWAPPGPA
jgi:uncharacterized protein (TIGR03086 family)